MLREDYKLNVIYSRAKKISSHALFQHRFCGVKYKVETKHDVQVGAICCVHLARWGVSEAEEKFPPVPRGKKTTRKLCKRIGYKLTPAVQPTLSCEI